MEKRFNSFPWWDAPLLLDIVPGGIEGDRPIGVASPLQLRWGENETAHVSAKRGYPRAG